jgi:hypothetical protein
MLARLKEHFLAPGALFPISHHHFRLDDRRQGRSVLVCLLAGYKADL